MALKQTEDGYYESQAKKPSPAQKQQAVQELAKQIKPGSSLEQFLQISSAGKDSK